MRDNFVLDFFYMIMIWYGNEANGVAILYNGTGSSREWFNGKVSATASKFLMRCWERLLTASMMVIKP